MNKPIKRIKSAFLIVGFIFLSIDARAVKLLENGKLIIPDRTSGAIKIDGNLNEKVWSNKPISEEFFTYYPAYGKKLEQETRVWLAYNSDYLYFAFKCLDNEPGKIKTSICRRDEIFSDDWVAAAVDAMGNKQASYEFFVNPNGIQGDLLNSAVSGTNTAPDFVWESAAKITDEGYQVEIAIPLKNIRFKSGKEVKMGILFLRKIARFGSAGAWPAPQPGQTDYNFMAAVIYRDIRHQFKFEALPNFTYYRDVERKNPGEWGERKISTNIGAGIKYGITSSITAEATINPDFSQVESDAFQVEVNQRYPVFYSEKRPFFMEGMDIFDFGIITGGMMISPVHTRRIVDPRWAGKLSGTAGRMSFALLAANDSAPGHSWANGVNPNEGKDALWAIARGKFNLGSDNSLGFLYSGRYFAGGKNNVIGMDFQYRFFKNARLTLSYLHSQTNEPGEGPVKKGNGLNAMLQYSTLRIDVRAAYERYDNDFVMYSAFRNRTNLSQGIFYIGPNLYIKGKGMKWLKRIQPYFQYSKLHDLGTAVDDTSRGLGADMYFSRQGFIGITYNNGKEAWQGRLFSREYLSAFGRVLLFNWFLITCSYRYGDQIYYHPEEPFLGTGHQVITRFVFQPNARLNLDAEWIYNDLYRKADRQKFYTINILNLLTTYQFNKYFFIRAAVRYNDYQKRLLTDFLASFTLIPGTVMHLGYGSLYESKDWRDNQWVPGQGGLLNIKNGLFFKVSYLWQIK